MKQLYDQATNPSINRLINPIGLSLLKAKNERHRTYPPRADKTREATK